MTERLKELREERGKIVDEMRAITDKAQTEKRDLSAEELAKHGELFGETEKRAAQIKALEQQREAERRDAGRKLDQEDKTAQAGERRASILSNPEYRDQFAKFVAFDNDEYRSASRRYLRFGVQGLTPDEQRALSLGVGSQGGFAVAPELFISDFIQFVNDNVFLRQKSTRFMVPSAQSLGVASLETDPADADWTAELAIGNEDSSMAFGKRKLQPYPLAKFIKISRDLLKLALPVGGMSIDTMVMQRLAYKFAITEEKAFLTGSGANQPLGLFTASADGIPTGRDISTGNTATSITFDGLISAIYGVKDQYRGRGEWLFHRDAIRQIATLKDSTNQYLWQPSRQVGAPDTILGRPYNSSEYVPNTFTTGLYVGMFADFSFYWIADAFDMEMQRLEELFAASNQVGIIGRQATDGQPVLAEAFARVKLG